MELTRRTFLKLGAAGTAAFALSGSLSEVARAMELKLGGKDISSRTLKDRQAVPSTCMQCVTACGIIGYVEDGRLVKLEGNPEAPNNRGRMCARGQAGVNQVYDPDRILYPMRRVGKRGEGKWKRITWDDALNEITTKLKAVLDSDKPEGFVFHFGRNRMSWILDPFMNAFGSASIGNHTSICEASKFIGQMTMWGPYQDVNDIANSKYILVMGSNPLEAHTVHNALCQRIIDARAAGARMITLDVRLSNTAARSDKWYPVKPGTDGLVALAMANVIMQNGLYDKEFIETWTNVTVDELTQHLAQFTTEMAARESGVPAEDIEKIAIEFATIKPSTIISYRGMVSHYNGMMNERCVMLLEAIAGNVDVKGGRCLKRTGKWANPFGSPGAAKAKIGAVEPKKDYPLAAHKVAQEVLPRIGKGEGKVQVYWTYCINPPFVMPDGNRQMEVLKDEKAIPFHICSDAYYSENASLADLILPDATYLERYDPETSPSYTIVPFIQVRQAVIKPLGESKPTQDVLMDLAHRLGIGAFLNGIKGSAEYLQKAADATEGLKDAGGWEYIRKVGVWYDKNKKPDYKSYSKELKPEDLKAKKKDERIVIDGKTGTIYKLDKDHPEKYESDKQYVGIRIGGKYYKGFKPYKFPISGKFEIRSALMAKYGFPDLPTYIPIPTHQNMKPDELILTTFKVNVHTQSRTQNCKWLTEIHNDNFVWINPSTAAYRGIAEGNLAKITSKVGSISVKAHVTEGIHPGVVAISFHSGHWQYGRYCSGKKAPAGAADSEDRHIWWKNYGVLPNLIIPIATDPIGGGQAYMDTVVTVTKA